MDTIKLVSEFMSAAGQEIKPAPGQPSVDVLKLRLSLELEELYEKAQAFGLQGTFQRLMYNILDDAGAICIKVDTTYSHTRPDRDIAFDGSYDTHNYDAVAVLDACADQRVVADGTILACGLQDVFPAAMTEVHRSNMSKFCTDMDEAAHTSVAYKEKGIETAWFARQVGEAHLWVVTRFSDGKVLKSLNYRPTNLAPLLEATNHV